MSERASTHPHTPTITAMMLVRDRADLIDAAAQSVLAQSETDLELVILDDGSTDDTPRIVARIASADDRVRTLRNEQPRGIPAARNQVLAAAQGRYLAVCDSDDICRPMRFAAQRALLDANDDIVGVGARFHIFEGAYGDEGHEPTWHWGLVDGRLPFLFPTAMLRIDAVRVVGGFDETFALAEDLELAYRLAAQGGQFAIVDDVLVAYRLHAGSITHARARAREWHNLRAQVRGLRLLRGRFSVRGWLVIVQSIVRVLATSIGVRR